MTSNEEGNIPTFEQRSFKCPHCGDRAVMKWRTVLLDTQPSWDISQIYQQMRNNNNVGLDQFHGVEIPQRMETGNWKCAVCDGCQLVSLWKDTEMVWPNASLAPKASTDMHEEVAKVFNEAREVVRASPRAAAALLRLAIEMLCGELGYKEGSLKKKIEDLVADHGISKDSERAFSIIRNVANHQVHPGTINLEDDPELAYGLFELTNFVIYEVVTKPKKVDEIESKAQSQQDGS